MAEEKKVRTEELILEARNFFNTYKKQIGKYVRAGKNVITVNFNDLAGFSHELSEMLINNPEEALQVLEVALEESGLVSNPRARFSDFPESYQEKIRNLRAKHLNKLIMVEGIVRQASEVRPQVVNAKFECPSCGTRMSVLQIESRFREPTRCSCGRKGGFKPVSKDMVDAQRLVIEESSESLTGGEQPRRISVFLKEDLVEPKMEEKTTPGSKINVIGILKEVIKHTQTGGQLTRYDIAIEANNLIPLEETFEEFDISEEDERQIQELAADPHVFKRFADSIAPSIYGYDEIKQCLVLQLFGGVKKTRSDGTSARGDLHVLLVGDPGTAKSVTLKFISQIAPKGRYVAGRGTSVDYNEPLLIRENNKQKFVKIGEFIDRFYNDGEEGFIPCSNDIEALSLNLETLKLEWKPVKALLRHENKEKLLSFSLETGRRIKVTKDHSIFCIEKGEIRCKPSNELKIGDYVIIPKIIPSNEFDLAEDVAKFLGYFIAEGNLYNRDGSYKIQFTLNKNEINIASEIKKVSEKYFKKEAKISEHGKNGMRLVIYGKEPYFMVCSWLGNIAHKLAKDKGIPEIVLNSNQQARHAFFDSYILGDAGVTKSERLMSELLYLKLQDKIIASCVETKMNKISLIENREIIDKGSRFDLKSPKINREFKNLRLNFPINCLPDNLKILFKKKLKSEYSRINLERIDNKMLFERMIRIFREEKLPGKRIRELFGKNSVEYFSEHSELFLKEKKGREIEISLTKEGTDIIKNVLKLRKLLDSDVSFVKIKKIEETEPTNKFVYDISTCEENFVAGFGGIVCHNTGAGLTATVVRDEFLRGWALEAGAMVLSNKGIVCLHPNSNIIADNKVIKIEELFNEKTAKKAVSNGEKIEISNLSIKIPSLLGNSLKFGFEDANLIRRKKYKGKMLKLRLESGFSFSLTPEHKLIDGNNLQWKEAKEFKKDDFLLAPLKLPENNSELYILDILPDNWIVCLEKSEKEELKKLILKRYKSLSDFNKKYNLSPNYFSGGKQLKIEIFKKILNELGIYEQWKNKTLKYGRSKAGESLKISKITPQLAYFMGFVYGDGNIEINKKHSSVQIVQSTKNEKQIEKIKCFFESFSDRDLGEYKRLSKSEIRERKLNSEHLILYSSSNFLSWLCEFFTKENLSNIFLMNNECLKAFIAGCLDSDGCISIKNCEKNGKNYKIAHIEFLLTNNERANKNFMLALRRFDCYSKLIQKKPISIVRITGRGDVVTLLNEISLYSVKTKEIPVMKKAISSISSKLPLEPVSKICLEIIRNCEKKEELNELGISSIIYDYKNKKIQPSREQLLKIKEKLNLPNEIKKEIEILLKKDFFIDKIVGIKEEVYEGYVYDIFVPKTHNFVCEGVVVHNCIDEIEKMDEQDRSAMHEAMEQQCVSISKANVQASLRAETSVLAAGNPKFGRFDPYQTVASQIDIPPALINRFDVIFIMKDIPDRAKDEAIATHVLLEHKEKQQRNTIDRELFRKYIAYSKQKIKPQLSDEAVDEIKKFYVELRNTSIASDQPTKPLPISARQLEALIRMSEAMAKLRLSSKVSREDAKATIELMKFYLYQVGYDYETKTFDIDRIATGVSTSQRSKIILVREALSRLESRIGKFIPIEEVKKELEEKVDEKDVDDALDKLTISGDIFHPRKGFVQRM